MHNFTLPIRACISVKLPTRLVFLFFYHKYIFLSHGSFITDWHSMCHLFRAKKKLLVATQRIKKSHNQSSWFWCRIMKQIAIAKMYSMSDLSNFWRLFILTYNVPNWKHISQCQHDTNVTFCHDGIKITSKVLMFMNTTMASVLISWN